MADAPDKIADWVLILNEWRLANCQPVQDIDPRNVTAPRKKVGLRTQLAAAAVLTGGLLCIFGGSSSRGLLLRKPPLFCKGNPQRAIRLCLSGPEPCLNEISSYSLPMWCYLAASVYLQ
jgi:hypothetical protein